MTKPPRPPLGVGAALARPSTRESVKVCLSSSIPILNTPSVQRQAVEGRGSGRGEGAQERREAVEGDGAEEEEAEASAREPEAPRTPSDPAPCALGTRSHAGPSPSHPDRDGETEIPPPSSQTWED